MRNPIIIFYLPATSKICAFLQNASEAADFIRLERGVPPEGSCIIERQVDGKTCACNYPGGILVKNRTLTIFRDKHVVNGYPAYVLPNNCSDVEASVIVAFFIRFQFERFSTKYIRRRMVNHLKIKEGKNTLTLVREHGSIIKCFSEKEYSCKECSLYSSDDIDFIFATGDIILSGRNKGPMVESVSDYAYLFE